MNAFAPSSAVFASMSAVDFAAVSANVRASLQRGSIALWAGIANTDSGLNALPAAAAGEAAAASAASISIKLFVTMRCSR